MEIKPEIFGKYVLLDKIATGGMAEIYLAKVPGIENVSKFVAIKRILPQYSNNHEFIEMFKEEAKIAININHANVVSIFEFGVQSNLFFLAMQYVDGKNLRQILNRFKKEKKYFTLPQIVFLIKEAAKGLDHAHRCVDSTTGSPLNITHRDISPQNIMLSYDGEIKIIDFGIAKAESKIETTRAGTLKGKFGYMSPEQADGFEVDFRTDIFSLGIVLWELLAQDRLFVSNNEINTLKKIRECHVPSLRKLDPNIPQELERITMKALARDRTLRYQSAEELAQDLQIFLNKNAPEFTSRDISQTLKTIFYEEREEARQKMIEYAQITISKDEKTQFVERTDTITETNSSSQTNPLDRNTKSQELNLSSESQIRNFDIEFDRQNLVVASSKKSNPRYNTAQKGKTKIGLRPDYQTQMSYPYTQSTQSVIIKRSRFSFFRFFILTLILGGGILFYMNDSDISHSFVSRIKDMIGQEQTSSSEAPEKKTSPSTEAYYNLLVTSIPSGANIFINDKSTDTITPGQVRVPVNQPYNLKLEKDGYYIANKSMLTTGQGDEVRINLKKMLIAYINISVSGGSADIFVNGKKISAQAPILKYPVPAKTHVKVQAYNSEKGIYAEKVLELNPNVTSQVHLNLIQVRKPSGRK